MGTRPRSIRPALTSRLTRGELCIWGSYVVNRELSPEERDAYIQRSREERGRHHLKIGFDRTDYGIIKRRILDGEDEWDPWWRIGHPLVFPNILRLGIAARTHNHGFRVAIDDERTLLIGCSVTVPKPGEPLPPSVVSHEVPWRSNQDDLYNDKGRLNGTNTNAQDRAAWVAQGPICDRTTEHLGVTDVGIIMLRKLFEEQFRIVEDGGDPMNVHRQPQDIIVLPTEHTFYPGYEEKGGPFKDLELPTPQVSVDLPKTGGLQLHGEV